MVFDMPVVSEAFYVEIMSTGFFRITLGQQCTPIQTKRSSLDTFDSCSVMTFAKLG